MKAGAHKRNRDRHRETNSRKCAEGDSTEETSSSQHKKIKCFYRVAGRERGALP